MKNSMRHQRDAVKSGYWPLYRFRPQYDHHGNSRSTPASPPWPFTDFARSEGRFAMLTRSEPERAAMLLAMAQADVDERWRYYEQLVRVERSIPHGPDAIVDGTDVAAEEAN